ncbi:amino acid/polyamine/organocation transporter (APC superfamily) [Pseudonocardia hierapolitana]|uniref:Amino acid/polyamine/organocation transporter (APC superfamily) n=1 Tax=Pseudonocardia hierapolitana TaxID=1128676 RepID=A0A561T2A7_9PSEU|nr:APC family permease [Pseudonocardia hierapolitana]TWF81247.1 amino acid/polyamine/organocation transporter (APC superfamily) [Pseudonocardia hierapolitana]
MSTDATAAPAATGGFHRTLGLRDVIAQSLSVIAPAMSGAFLTYLASTKAGGATPLAYLLGTLAMLAVGGTVAMFARSLSSAGSMYTYITHGGGKVLGFLGGWCYAAAFLVLGGAVLWGFGFFTASLVALLTGADPAWYWFSIAGLVVIALMSLYDIRASTRTQLAILLVTMVALLAVAVVVIAIGSPAVSVIDGTTPVADPGRSVDLAAFWPSAAGVSWTGVLFGLSFAMLSFTGAEASAVLSEETRDPRRAIPRAIIGSIVVAGLFYLVITYATAIGFGVQQAATDWPTSVAGLAAVAPNEAVGAVVLACAALASLFCALGVHIAVSRVLFAMGRERVLPAWLGVLHPRWGTPWRAIGLDLAVWALLAAVSILLTSREGQIALSGGVDSGQTGGIFLFTFLAGIGTPLVMGVYLLLGVAGAAQGRRTGRPWFTVTGVLAALVGALAVVGGLYYSFVPAAPDAPIPLQIAMVPWVCLAIAAAGLALAAWTRRYRRDVWADMGRIFDEV